MSEEANVAEKSSQRSQPEDEPEVDSVAEVVDHEVPALTSAEMERSLLIGISGVQAAGKTVFLSAIFHTVTGEVIDGIGEVSFDRTDTGGALYFERIENEIRDRGEITPTREPAVAKLLIEAPSRDGTTHEETGVILFDFAGKYFTEFADLPTALANAETPREKEELKRVNQYLERCDAFIVLVDSQNFGVDEIAKDRNPFPATILFLRVYCKRHNKPFALVFTKKDLNPDLSSEEVQELEMVRKIKQIFSDDLASIDRPFGLVDHLSCYEIDSTGDVLEQGPGNIWRPEPKQVFIKILRAAWPRALSKRAELSERAERDKEVVLRAERWRMIKRGLVAALLLLVLATPFVYQEITERIKNREAIALAEQLGDWLEQGSSDRITTSDLDTLRWLSEQGPGEGRDFTLRALKKELESSLDTVADTYPIGGNDKVATQRLLDLGEILGVTGSPPTRILRERQRFSGELKAASDPEEKLRVVRSTLQASKELDDRAFLEALETKASELREEIGQALAEPGILQSTLADRVRFVRLQLRSLEEEDDPQMAIIARRAYARFLGSSLAALQERERVVQLLTAATPDLSDLVSVPQLESKEVLEYTLVRAELLKSQTLDEAGARYNSIKPLLQEIVSGREESVQNLLAATLQDLFRGLGAENRKSVWAAFFDGAESEYFFLRRQDAWPSGVKPWIAELRPRLEDAKAGREVSTSAIAEISMRPLYSSEVSDIANMAAWRYLALATARAYREVVVEDKNSSSGLFSARRKLGALASLAERLGEEYTRLFDQTPSYFGVLQKAASSLEASVANTEVEYYAIRRLQTTLESSLKAFCSSSLRSAEGDCAN